MNSLKATKEELIKSSDEFKEIVKSFQGNSELILKQIRKDLGVSKFKFQEERKSEKATARKIGIPAIYNKKIIDSGKKSEKFDNPDNFTKNTPDDLEQCLGNYFISK